MFWRYWARERGSDPPVYSPVVRRGGRSEVLTTVISRRLPPNALLVGEFARRAGAGDGPAVPFDPLPAQPAGL